MFSDNAKKVIKVLDTGKYKYVLYVSDKKECDQIKDNELKSDFDIIAYGECKTMDIKTAHAVLPNPKFIHNIITMKKENSFHCFCCEKLGIEPFVGHPSPLTSWECLMNSIGNPKYCVITQELISND